MENKWLELMGLKVIEGGNRRRRAHVFDKKPARIVPCGDQFSAQNAERKEQNYLSEFWALNSEPISAVPQSGDLHR